MGGQPGDRNAVGSRRAGWRIIARVEQKDAQQATYARAYARKVEAELPEICHGILALKEKNSVSLASAGESKELYFKTKDECYQYLAECCTGDARSEAAEGARHETHLSRLGPALSSSVFHQQDPDKGTFQERIQSEGCLLYTSPSPRD